MAEHPEQPWQYYEKTNLLLEVIKSSRIHPHLLRDIILQYRIAIPALEEVALPQGRSLRSCSNILVELGLTTYPQGQPQQSSQHPQHFGGPVQQQLPHTPTQVLNTYTQQPQPQPQHRPLQAQMHSSLYPVIGGRAIRPKTSTPAINPHGSPAPTEPPAKKKRGRPTKAEVQARAEAAAATGTESGPPTRPASQAATPRVPPPPLSTTAATTTATATESRPAPLSSSTRFSIAHILTPTTVTQRESPPSNHSSGGSSGRRRRARARQSSGPEERATASISGTRAEQSPVLAVPRQRESGGSVFEDTPIRSIHGQLDQSDELRLPRTSPRLLNRPESRLSPRGSDPARL
ncbi:uncharacterized protein K489DRAFT_366565 [Dissoconium aciculare CBS 342.82]|uniref:Uncharacterized protein n=1 Tax=Dissoconium aciculare CBS 342.82 TaxID=1314786 RepID=A0A6J3MI74_9PEZI|nr:uncharacterized protein K489DRAFT_366565 [Dissoconium aciculare CBS 342.82]KAF1827409.1 hypothetical protein K489DRAFT_366565 [Dissoconium aciculare CBS 342.82]